MARIFWLAQLKNFQDIQNLSLKGSFTFQNENSEQEMCSAFVVCQFRPKNVVSQLSSMCYIFINVKRQIAFENPIRFFFFGLSFAQAVNQTVSQCK